MKQAGYATGNKIRRHGLEALRKVGLIRFMQQFDHGHWDYVQDRQAQRKELSC